MWCSMCTHCMVIYSKYTMCPSEVKEQNLFEKFLEKKEIYFCGVIVFILSSACTLTLWRSTLYITCT